MTEPRLLAPLRLTDVLRLMGQPNTEPNLKRLRRLITHAEARSGTKIAVRAAPGAPYKTSLAALQLYLPELFDPRVDTDSAHAVELLELLRSKVDDVASEIQTLRERDSLLLKRVVDVAHDVASLKRLAS